VSFDAVVVGAGVTGAALTRRLAADGMRVVCCGWEPPGRDATWAAAGMLCAQAEARAPGPFLDLLLAAEDRWGELAGRFEYRREGALHVGLDAQEREALLAQRAWHVERGLPVEFLEPSEVAWLERGLSGEITGANFFPRGGQVNNRAIPAGFLDDAQRNGAVLRHGRVSEVLIDAGRTRGVVLGAERLDADLVVVAAGAWTDAIRGLGTAAIAPVRGQMLSFPARPVSRPVFGAGGYVLPKGEGCVVGTTMERVGFDSEVTEEGRALLERRARKLCPSLASAPPAAAWAGLRPATADGLPALGPAPIEGLHFAVGLFRNGILLAPLVADLVAQAIEGDTEAIPPAFAASRLYA